MPIAINQGAAIPNVYVPNQNLKTSARDAIAHLQYANLWQNAGNLYDNNVMRVDMQGIIPGPPIQHNIQVQVDNLLGHSTVAHANVSTTLMTGDPANQRGALQKVITALYQSLDTGHSYTVTGSIP
jgi:hypothetical protein